MPDGTIHRPALTEVGTSVLDRLKSGAKAQGQDTLFLMRKFALERLMVRLAVSGGGAGYCLKGGMVMLLAGASFARPTEDLDFTALEAFETEDVLAAFEGACAALPPQEDGLTFTLERARSQTMREESGNPGVRLRIVARLHTRSGGSEIALKVDASYGDPVIPEAVLRTLPPTCKGFEPPSVLCYPFETVLAEKLHGIYRHGAASTRIRDYYDLLAIARSQDLDGSAVTRAVEATFKSRSDVAAARDPIGLSDMFAASREKEWAAFLRTRGLGMKPGTLREAMSEIRSMVNPVIEAVCNGAACEGVWSPGSGWVGAPAPAFRG